MASNSFAGGRGGIPTSNQRGFDSTSAHLSLQPAINEPFGQLYSPMENENLGQSFAASPPQLPPIQTGGRHRYRTYFSNPANMLPTNLATVPPNYGTPISNTIDSFERGMSFGATSMHGYGGSLGGGTELPGLFPLQTQSSRSTRDNNTVGLSAHSTRPHTSAQDFTLLSPLAPSSSVPQPPPTTPVTPPRRTTQAAREQPDNVIGYVLADKKKFRCSKKECHNSTFGRLADLRRHYDASHGPPNRAEYYCPHAGCSRSRHFGGGGGRSFGTRKDKCEEHIRNVHKSGGGGRRGGGGEGAQQYSPARSQGESDG